MNMRQHPAELAPASALRATVIGGDGNIGKHLIAHLHTQGWQCEVVTRNKGVNFDEPMGCVFYAAGMTRDFAADPHATLHAHVGLLSQVLQQGRFDSLVYLSSTRLYDSLPGCPGNEDAHLALNPNNPRHLFDLSKAMGESLCRHASAGRARVARLSCVVGGTGPAQGFVGELLEQVRRAPPGAVLNVDTTSYGMRDYVLMDDVLRALVLIATKGSQPIYNVASGENLSNEHLLQAVSDHSGRSVRALRSQRLPMPAAVSVERMAQEFGWRAQPLLHALPHLLMRELVCNA